MEMLLLQHGCWGTALFAAAAVASSTILCVTSYRVRTFAFEGAPFAGPHQRRSPDRRTIGGSACQTIWCRCASGDSGVNGSVLRQSVKAGNHLLRDSSIRRKCESNKCVENYFQHRASVPPVALSREVLKRGAGAAPTPTGPPLG